MADTPRTHADHESGFPRPEPGSARPAGSPADGLPTGSGLGKYRILERTRTSSTATIYKARDILLDRLVAIKQMHRSLIDDPVACGEFRREAQMMARCGGRSRHVIGIHELIEDDNGLFIVQDHLEGRPLDTLISKRQLDADQALRVMGTLSLGLQTLHAQGVVHRDLRPEFIMVVSGVGAVIADLSAAAPEGDLTYPTLAVTRYAAPELLRGDQYDDRVDIYSLGLIFHEMCVGRGPLHEHFAEIFRDPATAQERWKAWHVDESLALPDPLELNAAVPAPLAAIVLRMTAKSLDQRYTSVDQVIAALTRYLRERRSQVDRRLPGPGPIRNVGALPSPSRSLLEGPARKRSVSTSLTASLLTPGLEQTTTHRVARFAPEPMLSANRSTPEPGAEPAARRHEDYRQSASMARTRRQPVLKLRRTAVQAEAIPTPEAVHETVREEDPGRIRRILVATAAVLLVGASIWAYWNVAYGPGAIGPVQSAFDTAMSDYEAGRYEEARKEFLVVSRMTGPANTTVLRESAAWWVLLTEAADAARNNRFDFALERLALAENRGADRDKITDLRGLIDRQIRGQKLAAEINEDAEDGNLSALEEKLRGIESSAGADSPEAGSLKSQIERLRSQRGFREALEGARDAMESGDFPRALLSCATARRISDNSEVRELEQQIEQRKKREEWIGRGDASMLDRKYVDAESAYDTANRLAPDVKIEQKARVARAYVLFQEAKDAIEAGDLLLADRKLRNCLWYYELPAAREKFNASVSAFEAARQAMQGDRAVQIRDFDRAISLYSAALPNLPPPADADVRIKLAAAQRSAAIERGDTAARVGNWSEALTAFEEARKLARDDDIDERIRLAKTKLR